MVSEDRRRKEKPGMNSKFIGTKESVYIRKELNLHRIGLGHQHGRGFIALKHQYGRHISSRAYALYLALVSCLLFDC